MIALAALILLAPAPATAASLSGLYVTDQIEMAGALELRANGRFRYQFDYGAVSESAEGDWDSDGATIRLTSAPMPKQPDFALVRDDPAPGHTIFVTLEAPYQGWNGPIEGYGVPRDGGDPYDLDLDENGRSPFDSAHVKAIIPRIPVYGGVGSQIPVSPDRGHRLVLRFEPNDLGKAAFRSEPLALDGSDIVMHHYDTEIVFHRAQQ